jgi:hypothetical protein
LNPQLNYRPAALCGGALALLLLVSPATAQLFTSPDPNWREAEVALPQPPAEATLRRFFVSAASPNDFFIDEASLSVGEDGVVRYVLVVRAAGGAENVTYEGIRCRTGERRIYAIGRADGEWAPARRSQWEPIVDNAYNRPRAALAGQHFCDGPAAPRTREAALRGLGADPIQTR